MTLKLLALNLVNYIQILVTGWIVNLVFFRSPTIFFIKESSSMLVLVYFLFGAAVPYQFA